MIESYWFSPLEEEEYPKFNLDCLDEVIIQGEGSMRLGNFKSKLEAYQHIKFKHNYITYIRWTEYDSDGAHYTTEFHLKNRKLHCLGGPAHIETEYESTMFDKHAVKIKEKYFINGVSVLVEEFDKHPEVREAKLKRILKEK